MALTNKTKTKIFYTAVVVLIVALIGYAKNSRRLLEANHEVTNCVVDEVKTIGREQVIGVKYHFFVAGKTYKSDASFSRAQMSYENFKLLEDKSFPVAYNLKYFDFSSFILIFPKDYKDFNVPFPDSLNWILPLIKK